MQSATQHHHSSPQPSSNSAHSLNLSADTPSARSPQPAAARSPVPTGPLSGRNPRVRAAFAYAIPFVPALWLLARERRNRFVRLHAARSLIFFCCLAMAQVALFAGLVALGGTVTGLAVAAVVGVVFYVLYIVMAVLGFVLWLLLMRDALAGRATGYPLLGGWSYWLEERITRVQRRLFPSAEA